MPQPQTYDTKDIRAQSISTPGMAGMMLAYSADCIDALRSELARREETEKFRLPPNDYFLDPRGQVRRILKYGEDGPNGARSYWLAPPEGQPNG